MTSPASPGQTTAPEAHPSIGLALVRALIAGQHPDLAHLRVGARLDGWDMAMFRLGDSLAARLPRFEGATESLATEQRWLPELSTHWTFPYPRTERTGIAGHGYPWPWSIVTWLPGSIAAEVPLRASAGQALGKALAQVHRLAAIDAPVNREQSVPMRARDAAVRDRIARVKNVIGPGGRTASCRAMVSLWEEALSAPVDLPRSWIHADLHGFNVVSRDGEFGGILDWADLCTGDPAVDLGFLYTLLPEVGIEQAWEAYGGLSAATVTRARGVGLDKCTQLVLHPSGAAARMGWDGLTVLGVTDE